MAKVLFQAFVGAMAGVTTAILIAIVCRAFGADDPSLSWATWFGGGAGIVAALVISLIPKEEEKPITSVLVVGITTVCVQGVDKLGARLSGLTIMGLAAIMLVAAYVLRPRTPLDEALERLLGVRISAHEAGLLLKSGAGPVAKVLFESRNISPAKLSATYGYSEALTQALIRYGARIEAGLD